MGWWWPEAEPEAGVRMAEAELRGRLRGYFQGWLRGLSGQTLRGQDVRSSLPQRHQCALR